jgi:protoheme IX farnesyltransferase
MNGAAAAKVDSPAAIVRVSPWAILADYLSLTKPKIGMMVLIATATAAYVGAWGQVQPGALIHGLVGTLIIASGACALNQWLERTSDGLMPRTANRPLPAGRLESNKVFWFGAVLSLLGAVYFLCLTNWITATLGVSSWLIYVCIYTPLKQRTTLNTVVGAISGAVPMLIGWSISGAAWDLRALALFLVLFFWQFPHFMAIAWLYRKDYALANCQMLTVVEPTGLKAGKQAVFCAVATALASFIPAMFVPDGRVYLASAAFLGGAYFMCAAAFLMLRDDFNARILLRGSLIYLPLILLLLALLPHW